MRTLIKQLLLAVAVVAVPSHARADFYIVTHVSNAQPALTQKQAVDLFMGRDRALADGKLVALLDLPRDDPERAAFYLALTGMNAAQLNSYRARLMFSGQNTPPRTVADEAAVIDAVKRNPLAIGYLTREPEDKQLRTLLVLKERP